MTSFSLLGRSWDSFDAYLFDIDGTLLHCADAVHYFAFCDALQALTGRALTLEGVTAHGNTDVGILRDALALAGVPDADWRPCLPEMRQRMGDFVENHKSEFRANPLPKVREVLEHLRDQGATLGIATGNLQAIGKLKLHHAGLLAYFKVGGWSDDYEHRADVFGGAIVKMRAATSANATICVLGDTPADVLAAHMNNLPVIAVATGVYSREQLAAVNPELCLQSLEELFS